MRSGDSIASSSSFARACHAAKRVMLLCIFAVLHFWPSDFVFLTLLGFSHVHSFVLLMEVTNLKDFRGRWPATALAITMGNPIVIF